MKIKLLLLSLVAIIMLSCTEKNKVDANYAIVPLPQFVEAGIGEPFTLTSSTQIVCTEGSSIQTAKFLSEYIKSNTGLNLKITDKEKDNNVIILKTGYTGENLEAYQLSIDQSKIMIEGASPAGVFYGVQTLRKSIPVGDDIGLVNFQPVLIKDFPRFGYRGMHLDVSRHMVSVDSVKIYIDMLALHNVNRFHWHLTDDQGWRVEIKKYPELTKIGSMRDQTVIGLKNSGEYDGKPYGGFYTQEEIKEIVKYAEDRFITVIPEIDLPGHMLGVLATYPHLGCTGGPYKVAQTWGIFEDVLCAGNDDIYPFLEDIFAEIMGLFPAEYIHIGGDECPKTQWEKCPKCQAKIKELGIKADANHTAEQKLQSYIMQRVEKYLNDHGRKVIGWDEILEGGIAPNATIMSWRGIEGAISAAKQQHPAIMTPHRYLYFDYYQSEDKEKESFISIGYHLPVEKVYSYEPVPDVLSDEEKKFIIGVQANVWTEFMQSFNHVQYMALPRMAAVSEIQWTMPEKKNYDEFVGRLYDLVKIYDHSGYNYAKHVFETRSSVDISAEKQP